MSKSVTVDIHRHSRSTLQRSICAIHINFLPVDKRPQRWGYRQWHFSVRLIFCTIARQRLMNFQPVRAIWFSGVFYWLVDNLHTRPNRNIIKQIFDIVIAQTNTALTYPKSNTKIGIGTVDGIQPANINRVQPMGLSGPAKQMRANSPLVSHIRAECSALASRLELLVYVQR